MTTVRDLPILPQMTVKHRYRGAIRALLAGLTLGAGACGSAAHQGQPVLTTTASLAASTNAGSSATKTPSAVTAADVATQKAADIQAMAQDSGVTVTDVQVQCMAQGILRAVGASTLLKLGVEGDPQNLPPATLQAFNSAAGKCVSPDAVTAAGLDATFDSTTG